MGRNAIGFELDAKYKEECERRLKTEGTIPASTFDELYEDAEKVERFQNAQSKSVELAEQLKFDI